jgi:hypothetical protein
MLFLVFLEHYLGHFLTELLVTTKKWLYLSIMYCVSKILSFSSQGSLFNLVFNHLRPFKFVDNVEGAIPNSFATSSLLHSAYYFQNFQFFF